VERGWGRGLRKSKNKIKSKIKTLKQTTHSEHNEEQAPLFFALH
jgi:hypothetical protein